MKAYNFFILNIQIQNRLLIFFINIETIFSHA